MASLLPSVGTVRPLGFAVDAPSGSASFSATDVPTGYHSLSLQLKDNGALTMGAVEIVRIVEGQTTTGAYHFTNLNQATGGIQVTIGGGAATKPANQGLALSATVAETDVNATFVWSVNGEAVGTGDLWTMDDGWSQGHYRIDVTAFSADGTRAGSGTMEVEVINEIQVAMRPNSIAGGEFHALFIRADGVLVASGWNNYGQLGDGSQVDRSPPVSIAANVVAVSTGSAHSLFLKEDGTVWAFGNNSMGQLGNGSFTDSPTPLLVMSGASAISAGSYHSLVLKSDGSLWAFGANGAGQLGNGTYDNQSLPVFVLDEVEAISAGDSHSLAVCSGGTLWGFGNNNSKQLGFEPVGREGVHRPLLMMENVKSIAAGGGHSLVLRSDGAIYSFGANNQGQLGDGTLEDRAVPAMVLTGCRSVFAWGSQSAAITSGGELFVFGDNVDGQAGAGSLSPMQNPTAVLSDVSEVVFGSGFGLVKKLDGSLWGTGANPFGVLGDYQAASSFYQLDTSSW